MSLTIDVPGRGALTLDHLVVDFTGTLALDGVLLPGVETRLAALASSVRITVATADTFGTARGALAALPVAVELIGRGEEKAALVERLGPEHVVAIGNGRNDAAMLGAAALAIAVVGPEGAAAAALQAADLVVADIRAGLDLLLHPLRAAATMRE
ncbi:MAG: ATPase P [Acidobacteriota bacterium]